MAENKTQKTDANVEAFLNGVENERKRTDSFALVELMREVSGEDPTMWGSIVGLAAITINMPPVAKAIRQSQVSRPESRT